jgi:hypothetical protein
MPCKTGFGSEHFLDPEDCVFLGCDVALEGNRISAFQGNVLSYLHGSAGSSMTHRTLKVRAVRWFETQGSNWPVTQHHLWEERNLRLPPRCICDLCSSGMLCSVDWELVTDVLGQPIGPIFAFFKVGPMGCPDTWLATDIRCVASQQTEDIKNGIVCWKLKTIIFRSVKCVNM